MKSVQSTLVKIVFLLVLAILAGCSFATEVTKLPPSPQEVYFEDFSTWEVGTNPALVDGWDVVDRDGDYGTVEVVDAPGTASGKALRLRSELAESGNLSVYAPPWEGIDDSAKIVGFEYKINRVTGGGINQYLTNANEPQDTSTKVFLLVTPNDFRYSDGSQKAIGQLQEGWNTVRVVVNGVQNKADIFLNDELIASDTNLRNDINSWIGSRFRFLVALSATDRREVLYTDLRAWIIE